MPEPTGDEPTTGRRELWRKAWKGFLVFLEIIGLKKTLDIDPEAELAHFKLYHTEFRKLLSSNNSFLETVADLETVRLSGKHFDLDLLRRLSVRAVSDIHAMVESLRTIAPNRFATLPTAFDRISGELTSLLEIKPGAQEELVLDLRGIRASHADLVGGKMANLAELANVLKLPTPDGFAVTTEAYRLFLDEAGLRSWLQSCLLELSAAGDVKEWAETLSDGFKEVTLPSRLVETLLAAFDRLSARTKPDLTVAVRSSAVGEDSELSFAGQFQTVLGVTRERLSPAYLEVLASLYSPEAVHYRVLHHQPNEGAQMAVGVLELVKATAAGVAFSRDPNQADSGEVLIQAVRGLGVSLVEGRVSPEAIFVARQGDRPIEESSETGSPIGTIRRVSSSQASLVTAAPEGGLREEEIPAGEIQVSSLTDEEARTLAEWVLRIEAHFGTPQDVEWAIDDRRRLFLLQARPLKLSDVQIEREPPVAGAAVLLSGGETACPGVGQGPAVRISEEDDFDRFPEGAVLVAKRPSPKFVRLMSKTRAIVTDFGSTTGHMASLAREFRVPALLNTRSATQAIPSGTLITVDAANGYVYAGQVEVPLKKESLGPRTSENHFAAASLAEKQLLAGVFGTIVPLHLTDPRRPEFNPDQALTLHDLARYIHEKSFEVMFGLGQRMGDMRTISYLLDVFLPIDLYIIDLGGGFIERPKGRKVKRSQIGSAPMRAVLDGMLDKRLPRFGAKPMDLGGFFSVMMRHATENPEGDSTFHDPSYALISADYLNFTARVGYHFSVVDTYCGVTPNKNYISILFRGGAADETRRHRRVKAIAAILREHGFATQVNRDTVIARVSKSTQEETLAHLTMIGRLLQFFRQMDAAMTSEEAIAWICQAFLRGDYDLLKANSST